MELNIGDKAKHTLNDSIVEIVSFEEKKLLEEQQVNCKCLKSSIKEDVGQVFECGISYLDKLEAQQ
jgi:5'(3')-deoxyribonucleotidase